MNATKLKEIYTENNFYEDTETAMNDLELVYEDDWHATFVIHSED